MSFRITADARRQPLVRHAGHDDPHMTYRSHSSTRIDCPHTGSPLTSGFCAITRYKQSHRCLEFMRFLNDQHLGLRG